MGSRTDALKAAIDEAWRVFDMPAPKDLGVCTVCCMDPEEAARMQRTDARHLTVAQLDDWYSSAFAAEPTKQQVAWLLPRVMEILAAGGEVFHLGREVVLKRLRLSGFPDHWARAEVRAIEAFSNAAFESLIHGEVSGSDFNVDEWLCMFAFSGIQMEPFLARLYALPDDQLFDILQRGPCDPRDGKIVVSFFWEDCPTATDVLSWYSSNAMLDRLRRASQEGSYKAERLYDLIAASRASDAP